jgi:hypothetical protein
MLYVQLPNFPLLNGPSPFMRSEELNVQLNVPYHLGVAVEFGKGCVHGLFLQPRWFYGPIVPA